MTFSIVARSADGSDLGVAVASKFLAVGAAVPAAAAGVGALATQAYANLAYRGEGLDLLRAGRSAAEVVGALTAADPGAAQRQLGVVAADGDGESFTGSDCSAWAGGATGPGWAVQGNILTGPEVVEAMTAAFTAADPAAPLARRLLAALAAGDAAGGDRRGRQSAALLVVRPGGGYGGGSDVLVDLRVDDAPAPIPELTRLLDLHDIYFTAADPATLLPLTGALAEQVRGRLAELGYPAAPGPVGLDAAMAEWAGVENYEMRLAERAIDPAVLAALLATG